jgi:hypothetical protein
MVATLRALVGSLIATSCFCASPSAGLAAPLRTQDPAAAPASKDTALTQARAALLRGDVAAARAVLDAALATDPGWVDARTLRAFACVAAGDDTAAIADFTAIARAEPESPAGLEARFAIAQRFAALGRHAEASAATAEAVADLRGAKRRHTLATIYARTAAELLRPAQDAPGAVTAAPQPAKALVLLLLAEGLSALGADANAISLDVMRCEHAIAQDPADVMRRAALLRASNLAPGELAEIDYLEGHARARSGDASGAWDAWRRAATDPAQPFAAKALEDAALLFATSDDFHSMRDAAVDLAQDLLERFPSFERTPTVVLTVLQELAAREVGSARALQLLDVFIRTYAEHRLLADAIQLQDELLIAQGRLDEGALRLSAFLTARPADAKSREIANRLRDRRFDLAVQASSDAIRAGEATHTTAVAAARARWNDFLAAYPLDERAADASFELAAIDVRERAFDAALERYADVRRRFPNEIQAHRAAIESARILARERGNYDAAFAALAEVPADSSLAKSAADLAAAWRAPEIDLDSAVLQPANAGRLLLHLRNLASATIAIYRVRAEDVFTAHGTLAALDSIDVTLVTPERSFPVGVDGYAPYRRFDVPVDLPAEDASTTLIVTARSGDHEARAIALFSNAALAAVVARGAIEPIAFDRTTGALLERPPFRAAFDGVTSTKPSPTPPPGGFTTAGVFARTPLGDAFAAYELGTLPAPTVHAPLATLTAESPTYGPGDTIHVFGMVRSATEGRVAPWPQDARLRMVWTNEQSEILGVDPLVPATLEGFVHGSYVVPRDVKAARTIRCRLERQQSGEAPLILATSTFTITPAVPRTLSLTCENDDGSRAALTAGVAQRVTLRLRTDQPMPAVAVLVRVEDDAERRLLTDELGRVHLTIDGARTTFTDSVSVTANALGESYAFEIPVRHPSVDWTRPSDATVPFVVHEPSPLVLAAEAKDGAVAAGARARLTIRSLGAWARGPLLPTQELVADANGRASVTFTPPAPGPCQAWVEWTAPDGTLRTTSFTLLVFGDSAEPGLQILPPTKKAPHGATIALRVHAAIDAGPALFVTHARQLVDARIVQLQRGWNTIEVTLPRLPEVACVVSARALRGATTYAATTTIRLDQPLRIALAVDDGAPRTATARITDASAAPLAADVAYWLMRTDDAPRVQRSLSTAASVGLESTSTASALIFDGDKPLPQSRSTVDAALENALREIASATRADAAALLVESLELGELARIRPLVPEAEVRAGLDSEPSVGGGGGARYGRRAGGKSKKQRSETDGGERVVAVPAVARRLDARSDASGRSVWTLPARLEPGSYTVLAIASAGATCVGTASTTFTVTTETAVRVAAPTLLRSSDRARVRIELERRSDVATAVDVELETTLSDAPVRATVQLAARGGRNVTLELPGLRPGTGMLRVRAAGTTYESPLTVVPDGVPMVLAAATTDAVERAQLAVRDGDAAGVAELVLDAAAPAALLSLAEESDADDVEGDLRATALRLWTEIEALRATEPFAREAAQRREPIRIRAQRRLDRLGFWIQDATALDPLLVHALARAPTAGLDVSNGLRTRLDAALAERLAHAGSDAEQAWLLFCRGTLTDQDFGRVNRLMRTRAKLDAGTLALLANALAASHMTTGANDAFTELRSRLAPGRPAPTVSPFAEVTPTEIAALAIDAARALGQGAATAPELAALATGLEASASPALSNRMARILALRAEPTAASASATRFEATASGAPLAALVDAKPWQSARVVLTTETLAAGVELARSGPAVGARARLAQVRCVALERLPLAQVDAQHRFWRSEDVRDGIRVRVGDDVLRAPLRRLDWNAPTSLSPTRNVAMMLSPRITELDAPTTWWFMPKVEGYSFTVEYGALRVLQDARGTWLEIATPKEREVSLQLNVRIHAALPGTYAVPTLLLARSPGDLVARPSGGGPGMLATDAPDGSTPAPEWTPVERLETARVAFARDDLARTTELLAPLLDVDLEPEPAREVNRMALLCAVAADDAQRMVQCFEFAKERDPDFVVPFAATASVARAYRTLHEHERARQVDLALAEAGFLEEAQIVGALEQVGRALEATRVMVRLLREAPDTELVRQTAFALAQRAAQHARSPGAVPDPTSFAADMRAIAIETLEHRVVRSPRAADTAEVLLTLADVHRERADYAAMDAVAAAALGRDDLGRLAPAFEFQRAVAALAQRRFDDALTTARRVVAARTHFPADPVIERLAAQGRHVEAQVLQVTGDYEGARAAYAEVKDRFADAASELEFLDRAGIEVPALTTVRGAEPMRLSAKVRGQAKSIEIQVYRVDLRLLYLKQRGFDHLRDVRLAGLPPYATFSIPVPAASAQALLLDLDLAEPGAYLLALRAGDQQTRSIAIRSDLALDVRDDPTRGVRVHLWRGDAKTPVEGATVTFFDAATGRFITHRADVRGVAELTEATGPVALIAESGGHYAFFQGTTTRAPAGPRENADKPGKDGHQTEDDAQNELLQDAQFRNDATWKQNTNRRQLGVEVQRAKQ